MNRRTFLKAMVAVPVGLSLPPLAHAFADYTVLPLRIELRCGGRQVAVRSVYPTTDYLTYDFNLTRNEIARITRWDDLSIRFEGLTPAEISYVELSAPPTLARDTSSMRLRGRVIP